MEKILIIDNYDSFTYNLVQYVRELTGNKVVVKRNDEINTEAVEKFDIIIFSPGPGLPQDAGIMIETIKTYAGKKKMLGVCLGHQAIGIAFGGQLSNLKKVYHGVKTPVKIIDKSDVIFDNIDENTEVGRYHSWVIDKNTLPSDLQITSESEDGQIMSVKHKEFPIWGLQFHPESIMTEQGKTMIKNFLKQ
jgi:anthranilate synthase component 2